jgi:squalene cyclase
LADVQFAASLAAAVESGAVKDTWVMNAAASKVALAQAEDGSWPIDAANSVGSPVTYGSVLATYMAWDSLKHAPSPETSVAIQKAEKRLKAIKADNVPNASVLLLFVAGNRERATAEGISTSLDFLRRAQTSDGGWGPYADSPPEAFDTALALLALVEFHTEAVVPEMVRRGREFLVATQLPDGSWPATTRPSGGRSYAQQISTTGWATLALLATR